MWNEIPLCPLYQKGVGELRRYIEYSIDTFEYSM